MKAKKLIEAALPIKEISAESVRDKSIQAIACLSCHCICQFGTRPIG